MGRGVSWASMFGFDKVSGVVFYTLPVAAVTAVEAPAIGVLVPRIDVVHLGAEGRGQETQIGTEGVGLQVPEHRPLLGM